MNCTLCSIKIEGWSCYPIQPMNISVIGLSCERPLWCPMWNPALTEKSQIWTMDQCQEWWTPPMTGQDLTWNFFLKIQHVHGQKMTDPPMWEARISPRIFLKIQLVHDQKMTNPIWQARISPRIFFKDSTCAWSKDDWPTHVGGQDLT